MVMVPLLVSIVSIPNGNSFSIGFSSSVGVTPTSPMISAIPNWFHLRAVPWSIQMEFGLVTRTTSTSSEGQTNSSE